MKLESTEKKQKVETRFGTRCRTAVELLDHAVIDNDFGKREI